jgi:DNA-binding beta-propeller fold protein YncE
MKKLILAVLLLTSSVLQAQVPKLLPTGFQPLSIHQVADTVHVFCNGNDIDFDGIYEPNNGELPASWLKYHAKSGNLIARRDVTHTYFSIPFRPAFTNSNFYNPNGNSIEVYDMTSQQLIDSAILTLPNPQSTITALCVLSLNLNGEEKTVIAMSHKTSFTQNGSFGLYSIADKKIIAETEVGVNPQMIKAFRNLLGEVEFAILCEGTFGGKNSKLYRLLPTPNSGFPFKTEFYDLGDTGNYFIIQDQLALTVMNGSHEIIPINLATNTVLPGYPAGTTGYDGPREIVLDSTTNRVFVSTYASDIRIGSFISGDVLGILEPAGKPEGLAIIDGKLWACNAFKKGEYAPDSTIAIFDIGLTSVQEKKDSHISITLKQGICTIISEENFAHADIRVIDAHGKVVVSRAMSGHSLQFSMQDFPKGLYGIHVNAAKTTMNELLLHVQ